MPSSWILPPFLDAGWLSLWCCVCCPAWLAASATESPGVRDGGAGWGQSWRRPGRGSLGLLGCLLPLPGGPCRLPRREVGADSRSAAGFQFRSFAAGCRGWAGAKLVQRSTRTQIHKSTAGGLLVLPQAVASCRIQPVAVVGSVPGFILELRHEIANLQAHCHHRITYLLVGVEARFNAGVDHGEA